MNSVIYVKDSLGYLGESIKIYKIRTMFPVKESFLEKALVLELEQHLKENQENKRNGLTTKAVKSSTGEFQLTAPRDRKSTFMPEIVAKH